MPPMCLKTMRNASPIYRGHRNKVSHRGVETTTAHRQTTNRRLDALHTAQVGKQSEVVHQAVRGLRHVEELHDDTLVPRTRPRETMAIPSHTRAANTVPPQ